MRAVTTRGHRPAQGTNCGHRVGVLLALPLPKKHSRGQAYSLIRASKSLQFHGMTHSFPCCEG